MQKIRILYLITRFIKGGADEHVLLTIKNINKGKYDVYLGFGKEFDQKMVNEAKRYSKVAYFPLKHLSILSAIPSVYRMYRFMKQNRFDIVHTNSTEAGIVGRIAARLAGVPIIIHTVHGIAFVPGRPWIINRSIIFLERMCARFTTRIIAVSRMIEEEYLKKGIGRKEQFDVVYGGIDFSRFRPGQKQYKDDKDKIVISMISRLAKGKGHDTFIEAARIMQENKDVEFWIVGDGEYSKAIKEKIRALNLKNVKMLGHREDIPRILDQTDILALPSRAEGIPRIIMEAQRMRVPVISTRVGGVPEALDNGKAGILIPPANPNILAEKIIFLMENPKIAEGLAQRGHELSERFSLGEMIRRTEDIYDKEMRHVKNHQK